MKMVVLNMLSFLSVLLLIEQIFAMVLTANNEAMEFAEIREIRTRSISDYPRTISVQVTAFGETRNLELVPKDGAVFSSNFEGFVADVDKQGKTVLKKIVASREAQDELHSKLYTDRTGSASLYVERHNGHIVLEGMLDHETRIANDLKRHGRSLTDPANHIVFKRIEKAKPEGACKAVAPNITEKRVDPEDLHVATRALPTTVYVEVLLVIDYKTSSAFNFNLNEIKKYLAIFINAVNRRYTCPDTPVIKFVITGIIITNNEAAQPFLQYPNPPTTPPQLNSTATLYAFAEWMVTQRSSLTAISHDVAVWITGLEFASNVLGIAFVGGACWLASNMNGNVALVKDSSYSGVHTMGHELAHLLGSAHDGDIVNQPPGNPGAQSCPWSGGYIMSYEFGTSNKFQFSPCSCNQMKYTLNSGTVNCLLNAPQLSVVPPSSVLPGAVTSLDDQCKLKFGPATAFYEPRLSEACVKLWCGPDVQVGSFTIKTNGPAFEGSRCGVSQTCINGHCQ